MTDKASFRIPKGSLVMFSHGSYSDFCNMLLVKALLDLDTVELATEWNESDKGARYTKEDREDGICRL